jgi:hypothetical protein
MNASTSIPHQVKLPLRIACEVVIQGLRIRLGRSLVTITGVICGIAFLISILTGQLIKRGLAEEDARREQVARIAGFVRTDLPNLEQIAGRGVRAVLLPDGAAPALPRPLAAAAPAAPGQVRDEATVVLVMGDGPLPTFDWAGFFGHSVNAMAALTRLEAAALGPGWGDRCVKLIRPRTDDELAKRQADARKERFRGAWIVSISLLVTVIGITNAMLMSVTERFREIGTMKCLGALSSFVTRMFVIEASIVGLVGGVAGAVLGAVFALAAYSVTYGGALVLGSLPGASLLLYGLGGVAAGVILSIVSAIYPARVAAGMVPAMALRSTV